MIFLWDGRLARPMRLSARSTKTALDASFWDKRATTGVSRLKCCIIAFLWDGLLARPVRTGCPHHKIYIYALN
ncbi:hypothetical protein [Fischerella sp.]|uniref:hypothetical protein n=1 Tax=Fischerella sp. TaxID=1191 RepID=UPI0025BD57E6|nr:hypothetical protein [Fischerella sp.]